MRKVLFKVALSFGALMTLHLSVQAQDKPNISPVLQKMLGALPIPGMKDKVSSAVAALKKTSCGGGLTGCYTISSGAMQLYFFTHKGVEQTFLLVLDQNLSMATLFGKEVQQVFGKSGLQKPIFSISTTDYDLNVKDMPDALKTIVKDSYFGVDTLSFPAGVQLATRVSSGGPLNDGLQALGVKASQFTIRAGVVLPIPTDLTSATGSSADIAMAVKHGDTMKKSVANALMPEAYVEFQFAPGSSLPMLMPPMSLEDMTLSLNNALTFGYKGNARFNGTSKRVLLDFKTPLTPEGAMDFADFTFRMAMPAGGFSLEDAGNVILGMYLPTPPSKLAKDGGFIGDIKSIKKPLQDALKPLAMFKLANPRPPADYKFGDASRPFPKNDDPFNIIVKGPLADGGPYLRTSSALTFMGLPVGSTTLDVGLKGFHASAEERVQIPLGPLGQIGGRMKSSIDLDGKEQKIKLQGDFAGRDLSLTLDGSTLLIDSPAICLTPVEFKAKVSLTADMDINKILKAQGGVNVDPSQLTNCVGANLEAALKWITTTGKDIGGYTAVQANAELTKISNAANLAAKQAEEAARQQYENTKNAARTLANSSGNSAMKAFNDAGNFIKGFGKKKHKGGDNRFAPSVFDWDYYYDHNPDVVKAGINLAEHWSNSGFAEARRGSYEFDLKYFRKLHPGVSDSNLLNYWVGTGINNGDPSSPDFSIQGLVARNNDLKQAFGTNYRAAFDWWMENGDEYTNRDTRPLVLDAPAKGLSSGPKKPFGN